MYKRNKLPRTTIKQNTSYKGERIEEKVERIVNNKEPISDGAPIIYTDRKDGVLPAYDIRTDRFEIAVEAMDKVSKAKLAKRTASLDAREGKKDEGGEKKKDGGAEPIQTT